MGDKYGTGKLHSWVKVGTLKSQFAGFYWVYLNPTLVLVAFSQFGKLQPKPKKTPQISCFFSHFGNHQKFSVPLTVSAALSLSSLQESEICFQRNLGLIRRTNPLRNITSYQAKETQCKEFDQLLMLVSANTACPPDTGYSVEFTTV